MDTKVDEIWSLNISWKRVRHGLVHRLKTRDVYYMSKGVELMKYLFIFLSLNHHEWQIQFDTIFNCVLLNRTCPYANWNIWRFMLVYTTKLKMYTTTSNHCCCAWLNISLTFVWYVVLNINTLGRHSRVELKYLVMFWHFQHHKLKWPLDLIISCFIWIPCISQST